MAGLHAHNQRSACLSHKIQSQQLVAFIKKVNAEAMVGLEIMGYKRCRPFEVVLEQELGPELQQGQSR